MSDERKNIRFEGYRRAFETWCDLNGKDESDTILAGWCVLAALTPEERERAFQTRRLQLEKLKQGLLSEKLSASQAEALSREEPGAGQAKTGEEEAA